MKIDLKRGDRRKIVNFSRRVDCAPFEEWFVRRLNEGYAYGINPFTRKPYEVKLTPEHVKLMILWTKAPGKILGIVNALLARGFNVAVFVTINDYSKWLEPLVPSLEENLSGLRNISHVLGSNAVWWRFDPVVPTDKQDLDWFMKHFDRLARKMKSVTSRCITSIVHTEGPPKYRRCAENISNAATKVGQKFKVLTSEEKLTWMGELSEILYSNMGIPLEVCCHPFLDNESVHPEQPKKWPGFLLTPQHAQIVSGYPHMKTSHCIRAESLEAIGVGGDKRNGSYSLGSKRKGDIRYDLGMCLCRQSTDIGGTVACPHGCVYCQWPHAVEEEDPYNLIDVDKPALTPTKLGVRNFTGRMVL